MAQRDPHTIRVTSTNVRERQRAAPPTLLTSRHAKPPRRPRFSPKQSEAFRIGERLLRDSALCAAVVLCVLALGNVQQPWAQAVSSTMRDAVTMDLDESLGKLQFVRNLLPESALVFWDSGSAQPSYQLPASGSVTHAWKQSEPWLEYACEAQSVVAAAAGEVMTITQGDEGHYLLRIRHEGGTETLYGDLVACIVQEGDSLQSGQILGTVEDTFFFEARKDGRALNPTSLIRER